MKHQKCNFVPCFLDQRWKSLSGYICSMKSCTFIQTVVFHGRFHSGRDLDLFEGEKKYKEELPRANCVHHALLLQEVLEPLSPSSSFSHDLGTWFSGCTSNGKQFKQAWVSEWGGLEELKLGHTLVAICNSRGFIHCRFYEPIQNWPFTYFCCNNQMTK